MQCMLGDTANKLAVRILLECILVLVLFLDRMPICSHDMSDIATINFTNCVYVPQKSYQFIRLVFM